MYAQSVCQQPFLKHGTRIASGSAVQTVSCRHHKFCASLKLYHIYPCLSRGGCPLAQQGETGYTKNGGEVDVTPSNTGNAGGIRETYAESSDYDYGTERTHERSRAEDQSTFTRRTESLASTDGRRLKRRSETRGWFSCLRAQKKKTRIPPHEGIRVFWWS